MESQLNDLPWQPTTKKQSLHFIALELAILVHTLSEYKHILRETNIFLEN